MTLVARFRKIERSYYKTLPQNDEVYEVWEKDGKQYVVFQRFNETIERFEEEKIIWTDPPLPENTHRTVIIIKKSAANYENATDET